MAPMIEGEHAHALLSVAQAYEADRLTIEGGTAGTDLMESAGIACVATICGQFEAGPVSVLCGPGNNGGDGFVIARHLKERGWPVRLALLGNRDGLKGDAAHMADLWDGPLEPLGVGAISGASLIVDAIFGAGLARPVEGEPAAVIAAAKQSGVPVFAIDVPTGVHGDSGRILGCAFDADLTVTFFRRKPGHLLLPGRLACGETRAVDIGNLVETLDQVGVDVWRNDPALWRGRFPWPRLDGHKYQRGHALVVSGGVATTGAARLGARSALRVGAGLVTVASPPEALLVTASHLTAVMTTSFKGSEGLAAILRDTRKNAVLIGPGNGVGEKTKGNVLAVLASGAGAVLDADALTSFEKSPEALFGAIHNPTVMTPHTGELARLFPDLADLADGKLEAAREAARRSGAVVVLKGADTVIAEPDGRAVINDNAPPELATAGAGDVLGGLIAGLLAQGMVAFDAACAAVWLHGASASQVGPGLIAEDLPDHLPVVLKSLKDGDT